MFQRWTTCVTTLCLSWVAIGLVQWLSNTPHPLQVAEVCKHFQLHYCEIIHHFCNMLLSSQVCIPMMILPLLCAAYAEVNGEGKRLLKVIVNLSVTREHSSYLSVCCNIYFSVSVRWSRDYMHFTSCGSLHPKWLFLVPCHFFFIWNFIRYLLSFKIALVFRIFQRNEYYLWRHGNSCCWFTFSTDVACRFETIGRWQLIMGNKILEKPESQIHRIPYDSWSSLIIHIFSQIDLLLFLVHS